MVAQRQVLPRLDLEVEPPVADQPLEARADGGGVVRRVQEHDDRLHLAALEVEDALRLRQADPEEAIVVRLFARLPHAAHLDGQRVDRPRPGGGEQGEVVTRLHAEGPGEPDPEGDAARIARRELLAVDDHRQRREIHLALGHDAGADERGRGIAGGDEPGEAEARGDHLDVLDPPELLAQRRVVGDQVVERREAALLGVAPAIDLDVADLAADGGLADAVVDGVHEAAEHDDGGGPEAHRGQRDQRAAPVAEDVAESQLRVDRHGLEAPQFLVDGRRLGRRRVEGLRLLPGRARGGRLSGLLVGEPEVEIDGRHDGVGNRLRLRVHQRDDVAEILHRRLGLPEQVGHARRRDAADHVHDDGVGEPLDRLVERVEAALHPAGGLHAADARGLADLRAAEPGEGGGTLRVRGDGLLEHRDGVVGTVGVERLASLDHEVRRLGLDVVGAQDGEKAKKGDGLVFHRSLPSEISSTRSAADMIRGSWVENTKVTSRSRLRRRISSTMSRPVALSRLAVGSSALAARELRRPVARAVAEADLLEGRAHAGPAVAVARPDQQRVLDVLPGGEDGDEVEGLEDEAELARAQVRAPTC